MAGRFIAAEICLSFLTQLTCLLTQALATLYPIPSPLHCAAPTPVHHTPVRLPHLLHHFTICAHSRCLRPLAKTSTPPHYLRTSSLEASQLSDDHLQWIQRTDRLIYEWLDKDGNTRTSAWSKAVRNAMRQGLFCKLVWSNFIQNIVGCLIGPQVGLP